MTASKFHPELRLAPYLPRAIVSRRTLGLVRRAMGLVGARLSHGAVRREVSPEVSVRVFGETADGGAPVTGSRPALLWIHGGGMIMGGAGDDAAFCSRVAQETGALVASVEYRLAPEHPFPTPLEDCYVALQWLARQPGVDPGRVAVGGASAGGGLAAGLALLVRERGGPHLAFQLLVYPMIDDRTTTRTDVDTSRLRLWNQSSNSLGWRCYLGPGLRPGQPTGVPVPAAPARAGDLAGLPPAWVGVGDADLFHDEDRAYAERLEAAGVPCTLHVVPGAYHGFDVSEAWTPVARDFRTRQVRALVSALAPPRSS
ncbi:MAG: alpha/beta hydrolase [Marmoricola sp.]|nr:alpha/beta hydrolase [Marmoricola sp.]